MLIDSGVGITVLYELLLIALLLSSRRDARRMLLVFYEDLNVPLKVTILVALGSLTLVQERDYATHCDFTWENVSSNVFDIFFVSHFLGWVAKRIVVRCVRVTNSGKYARDACAATR